MLRADPSKIAAARGYFERKFPGWTINDHHETDTITEVFTIEGTAAGQVYTVKIARKFLDDFNPQEIERRLTHWHVEGALESSGQVPLLITSDGATT